LARLTGSLRNKSWRLDHGLPLHFSNFCAGATRRLPANDLLTLTGMKIFAAGAVLWSLLVLLYAFSPFAGIAALAAGYGFVARGAYRPVRVRHQ
jgi:hypothetical protein